LEGGIQYAKQIKKSESKFIGKNFCFDHRLGERIHQRYRIAMPSMWQTV
jgi:predicted sulfurtransferase